MSSSTPSVVILVPGLAGSELYSTSEKVWPGVLSDYFSYPERKLRILINDPLEPRNVIRSVLGVPIYQALVDYLGTLGYSERPVSSGRPNLFVFPYDWRQDLIATTGKLADRIVQIFQAYGGKCAITLLAHSTGGMISRCLLESGQFDVALGSGARRAIRQLVTMGTAGRGAPRALAGILGLDGLLFLEPGQAARLAAAPKYPAAYQHMPAPLTAALWDVHKALQPRDLYATDVGNRLGLLPGHVAAAANFWSTLAYPVVPGLGTRYFCFVGSHHSTLSGFMYDESKSGAAAVDPLTIDDGGDNTVPIWSADPPGLQVQYVGGEHAVLFKDTLLKWRLSDLLPPVTSTRAAAAARRAAAGAIDASVDGLVLRDQGSAGRTKHIVVKLSIGSEAVLKGGLIIEWRPAPRVGVAEAAWIREPFKQIRRIPIDLPYPPPTYHGVTIGKLGDFKPGQYRAYFVQQGGRVAGEFADFILQGDAGSEPLRQGGRSKAPAAKKRRPKPSAR